MTCNTCENDLAQCTCEDLPERWEEIKQSEYLVVGVDYGLRIQAQADKIKKAREQ